MKDKSLELLPI